MQIKHIIVIIVLLVLIIFRPVKENAYGKSWLRFSDQNIGIELEYPEGLKPYFPTEVNLRECDECPGSINIEKKIGGFEDVEEAMRIIGRSRENIIGETLIGGQRAIVTTLFNGGEKNEEQRTAYLIKNGNLYIIGARFIDFERLWNSVKID